MISLPDAILFKGLSLEDLRSAHDERFFDQGARLGVTPSTISGIERGLVAPPEGFAERVVVLYGLESAENLARIQADLEEFRRGAAIEREKFLRAIRQKDLEKDLESERLALLEERWLLAAETSERLAAMVEKGSRSRATQGARRAESMAHAEYRAAKLAHRAKVRHADQP